MRTLSPDFAAALASGATTLCHCWRLTRRDGAAMGFTDHDCDLAFAGVTFRASTGLDAAQADSAAGLAVGSGDVQGALVDGGIDERDLQAGLYDDAAVEIWLVDWSNVANRVLMDAATIGEVKRSEFSFVAELRSLAHRFDEERGRQFQRGCSADLGDCACRIALDDPLWSTGAAIVAVERPGSYIVATDAVFSSGFFTDGSFAAAGGASAPIKLHEKTVASDRIVLWSAPAITLCAGARVTLRAGCDKSPETCREKFDNIINFRGFPHMPGNDVVVAYPNAEGAPMDGGESLPMSALARADIVSVARAWVGTPYLHQASLRGVGCDCIGLVRGLWRELIGPEPEPMRPYTADWAEAGGEETLIALGEKHFFAVDAAAFRAGDLLVFRFREGAVAKHVGVATDDAHMIHAHDGARIAEVALGAWRRRIVRAFAFPGLQPD